MGAPSAPADVGNNERLTSDSAGTPLAYPLLVSPVITSRSCRDRVIHLGLGQPAGGYGTTWRIRAKGDRARAIRCYSAS